MKRMIVTSLIAVSALVVSVMPAGAAARVFKNCTAMHKVYKGGVKRPGAVQKGGKLKYKAVVSAALYNANKSKDRDKDGLACEA